jgi:hypothetical protein
MQTSSSAASSSPRSASVISASGLIQAVPPTVQPGTIVLHRIPRLPYCVAMYLVSTTTPALAAP